MNKVKTKLLLIFNMI